MKWQVKVAVLSLFISSMVTASDFQIMFETTDCNGESGFATAKVEDIYKIQNGNCNVSGSKSEKLKQILIKNGRGSYDTFSLTASEANNVVQDMKSYMRARLKNLENANTLIITQ